MLWDGCRVPFTLVGGYLGAGKTTIVNHLLRNAGARRLVVLVNDLGAVDVDALLVAEHDGETITLTNGCVCCAIADDFGRVLEQLRAAPEPPDHVVMELSGVGEPARVAPWANTAGFRLDGIVVAADADQITDMVDRRFVGETIREQLRTADVVLLTKTDLAADGGAAARELVRATTEAPIVDAVRGVVDADVVLGIGHAGEPDAPARPTRPGHPVATTIELGDVTAAQLQALIDGLDPELLRAKGLVRCTDRAHPIEVHVVGRRRSVRERTDRSLDRASTQLVVIA